MKQQQQQQQQQQRPRGAPGGGGGKKPLRFKNKLLGPRRPMPVAATDGDSKQQQQRLPSYKNRMRSIERLLRRVRALVLVLVGVRAAVQWGGSVQ
jgi:hypothetical protein